MSRRRIWPASTRRQCSRSRRRGRRTLLRCPQGHMRTRRDRGGRLAAFYSISIPRLVWRVCFMSTTTSASLPEGLLTLAASFIQKARRRLRDELAHSCDDGELAPIDAESLEELLFPQLANQMFMLVAKT